MSAANETRTFAEDYDLTDEMLEAVSGGEINVAEEISLDRFIGSSKDRGETLDEVIAFMRKLNAGNGGSDLKGFWASIANAEPGHFDEMVDYLKQNW